MCRQLFHSLLLLSCCLPQTGAVLPLCRALSKEKLLCNSHVCAVISKPGCLLEFALSFVVKYNVIGENWNYLCMC